MTLETLLNRRPQPSQQITPKPCRQSCRLLAAFTRALLSPRGQFQISPPCPPLPPSHLMSGACHLLLLFLPRCQLSETPLMMRPRLMSGVSPLLALSPPPLLSLHSPTEPRPRLCPSLAP